MEHDEPILQKLTDVSVTFSEKPMVSCRIAEIVANIFHNGLATVSIFFNKDRDAKSSQGGVVFLFVECASNGATSLK